MKKLADFTIIVALILFFVLLMVGVIISNVLTIAIAFVCGFIGFAIADHESQVDYEVANKGDNQ